MVSGMDMQRHVTKSHKLMYVNYTINDKKLAELKFSDFVNKSSRIAYGC